LDRVILFTEAGVESLREAYRLTKILWNLNRDIEFFLLFRGTESPEDKKEFLFERFSLAASRFLGITTGWLGSLDLPRKDSCGFNPEPILEVEGLKRPPSPEKIRFWNALQRRFQGSLFPPPATPPREEFSTFTSRLSREELREFIQFEIDTVSSKGHAI